MVHSVNFKGHAQLYDLLFAHPLIQHILANGKTTTLSLFLDISFQKQRYHVSEMLPLETKLSGGKLLPQSDLRGGGGGVCRGKFKAAVRQEEGGRANFVCV
jgi:hypothetical protein